VVRLEKDLKRVFPTYADLVSPKPASAAEVAALLGPDEALVYMISGQKRGYVFVVRPTGTSVTPLEMSRESLTAAIRELRKPFENPGSRIAPFDLALAHRLYGRLLGPSENALEGVRHMILVSSSELLSLPFSLLITAPAPKGDDRYRKANWLVRNTAITQMPSVRTFASFRQTVRPSKAPLPFIGFGNPAFRGGADGGGLAALSKHCQLGAAVPRDLISGLAALPETAGELRRVARALKAGKGSIHLGAMVTEARVRELPLDQYRVIYFATHGLLPGDLHCQSQPALALSPPQRPTGDRNADGLFEASEIATLKLDADLVVLSACNTGGGGSGKLGGESLSGLARAFFQAGTRSVLVSHWQVDTVATARLMTRLFEKAADKSPPSLAAALQRSQLDLLGRASTAHPFFWAAFTFVGEGSFRAGPRAAGRPPQLGRSTR
jgi:CHAT domain-containing protein